MIRKFLILDKTNGCWVEIEIDDRKQYLEVWGLEVEDEKVVTVQAKYHMHEKPPFAIINRKIK